MFNKDFITTLLNVASKDIKEYECTVINDTVYYDVLLVRKPLSCPFCGEKMIGHGKVTKHINHPALRNYKGIIRYHANRYICKICRKTTLEQNPFSLPNYNSSFLLIQTAMNFLSNLNYNLEMISNQLNISRTQLNRYIDSYITIPKRRLPECLGIDEIHNKYLTKRNSSYLCVLVDNNDNNLYDVLDSRSKMNLSLYFSSFSREERKNVKYVTIDMWRPYKDVSITYFPNAIIAVDPFHVVKHLVKGFEELRIKLMNNCEYNSNGYYLLKKWNWLLKKNNVDWDNNPRYNKYFGRKLNHRDIRSMIFDNFPELKFAYDLKTEYQYFNKIGTYEDAKKFIPNFIKKFKKANIPEYRDFTNILSEWTDEIINSFQRPYEDKKLSNAFTENINGRIKVYFSVSKGVANFQRFRKRVIFALNKDVNYSLKKSLKVELHH